MILDDCINWRRYLSGNASVWCQAFELIRSLTPDVAEGRQTVLPDQLYANIFSYDAKPPEECSIESHRKFIDIQTLLVGQELLAYCPLDRLSCSHEYDEEGDYELFQIRPEVLSTCQMVPGNFAIFFPGEGHCALQHPALPGTRIKKVVVKVAFELLQSGCCHQH